MISEFLAGTSSKARLTQKYHQFVKPSGSLLTYLVITILLGIKPISVITKIFQPDCKLCKAHYLDCLQEHCASIGITEIIKSNGDPTLLSALVKQFLNQHTIHNGNRSESANQQQNHAECGSGIVKHHIK